MAANTTYVLPDTRAVQGAYNPFPAAIPNGDLVQQQTQTAAGSGFTGGQFGNLASIIVNQAGTYECWASADLAALGSETDCQVAISQISGNTTTDQVRGLNQVSMATVAAAGVGSAAVGPWYVAAATGSTFYLKVKLTGAVGNSLTGTLTIKKLRTT